MRSPGVTLVGFPHSETRGSSLVDSSPRLIAVFRVLLRLLAPRYPPYALCSLTYIGSQRLRGDASPQSPWTILKILGSPSASSPLGPSTRQPSYCLRFLLSYAVVNVLPESIGLRSKPSFEDLGLIPIARQPEPRPSGLDSTTRSFQRGVRLHRGLLP